MANDGNKGVVKTKIQQNSTFDFNHGLESAGEKGRLMASLQPGIR